MTTHVEELTTDEAWDRAVPILGQLWPDKSTAEIRGWREEAYHLLGLYADGELVAVAGIRPQTLLRHERTAWINDLVVDEAHRGRGHGTRLLDAAADWATDHDCEAVALVSHRTNDEATAFYDDRMERFGHLFQRTV